MQRLTAEQELTISRFQDRLSVVVGPDDMFPPDFSGDRSPTMQPLPGMPASEELCLAAVYNMLAIRERRTRLAASCGELVTRIDLLVGA